jgi:hypothetical protein
MCDREYDHQSIDDQYGKKRDIEGIVHDLMSLRGESGLGWVVLG